MGAEGYSSPDVKRSERGSVLWYKMVGNEKVKCLKWTMTLNGSSDEASLDKKGLAMKKDR